MESLEGCLYVILTCIVIGLNLEREIGLSELGSGARRFPVRAPLTARGERCFLLGGQCSNELRCKWVLYRLRDVSEGWS